MELKASTQKAQELFGNPLGKVPDIAFEWRREPGIIYWADSTIWSLNKIQRRMEGFKFLIFGPYAEDDAPFRGFIPCEGYAIFIPN